MGGSSPSVFHTAPPQPASKARLTLYALSVGGADASQNGFGDWMPRNVVVRSAMSRTSLEKFVDGERREFAVLYGGHGQVLAAVHTVAAGPHAGYRSFSFVVAHNASVFQFEQLRGVGKVIPEDFLSDRLENDIGIERPGLPGSFQSSVASGPSRLEFDAADAPVRNEQCTWCCPGTHCNTTSLRELLFVAAGIHVFLAAAVGHGHFFSPERLALHRDVDR